MLSGRETAEPTAHHLDLAHELAGDIRRHLDRLGRMRGLVTLEVGATGAYRIALTPVSALRLGDVTELGIGLKDAMALLDDVMAYDPDEEAAVLIVETNPIDGALLTFLVQSLREAR